MNIFHDEIFWFWKKFPKVTRRCLLKEWKSFFLSKICSGKVLIFLGKYTPLLIFV